MQEIGSLGTVRIDIELKKEGLGGRDGVDNRTERIGRIARDLHFQIKMQTFHKLKFRIKSRQKG